MRSNRKLKAFQHEGTEWHEGARSNRFFSLWLFVILCAFVLNLFSFLKKKGALKNFRLASGLKKYILRRAV
jgi:hypothetical protein